MKGTIEFDRFPLEVYDIPCPICGDTMEVRAPKHENGLKVTCWKCGPMDNIYTKATIDMTSRPYTITLEVE